MINPLRTRRHAEENLKREKTDSIDAVGIGRFMQEKKPAATTLPDEANLQLRELVRLRDRVLQDMVDKVNQLHRVIDLGFPEFRKLVKDVGSGLATSLLSQHPTAQVFAAARVGEIANLVYDGPRTVGRTLAQDLVTTAKRSVGQHDGPVYDLQARYACQDIAMLRERLKTLEADIHATVDKNDLAKLLTSIDGIGPTTAARITRPRPLRQRGCVGRVHRPRRMYEKADQCDLQCREKSEALHPEDSSARPPSNQLTGGTVSQTGPRAPSCLASVGGAAELRAG